MTTASGSPWLVAALPDAESASDREEPVRIEALLDGSLSGKFMLVEGYRAGLSTVSGLCSKSSLRRQLEECEMALEQLTGQLGEI